MHSPFFFPSEDSFNPQNLWNWYLNIPHELNDKFLDQKEKNYLYDYYREAGLLRNWRKNFFKHHFCLRFSESVSFLMVEKDRPTIVDLGCGCGTQSLYFALMGAKVIAVDIDEIALEVFRKRIDFYQSLFKIHLDVSISAVNSFECDYASFYPIDGVHSMFAFNMMQPSSGLISSLLPYCSRQARIAIHDGNNMSWLPRCMPWRRRDVWTPLQFRRELECRGFAIASHTGGIALPPVVWCFADSKVVPAFDRWLCRSWFYAISHHILAERLDN